MCGHLASYDSLSQQAEVEGYYESAVGGQAVLAALRQLYSAAGAHRLRGSGDDVAVASWHMQSAWQKLIYQRDAGLLCCLRIFYNNDVHKSVLRYTQWPCCHALCAESLLPSAPCRASLSRCTTRPTGWASN